MLEGKMVKVWRPYGWLKCLRILVNPERKRKLVRSRYWRKGSIENGHYYYYLTLKINLSLTNFYYFINFIVILITTLVFISGVFLLPFRIFAVQ
jgi:hypothetical protein